ncbi:hypothetical protein [Ekhidna sp.]
MNVRKKRNFFRTQQVCSRFGALIMIALVLVSCGDDDGGTDPANLTNVRLLNVDAPNNQVTLKNFGSETADISGYWFCLKRSYSALEEATTDAADLNLDANEEITFTINIDDEASDVSIYNVNGSFGSADALIDFMQFGSSFAGSTGREDVAVTKGIWTAGDFLEVGDEYSYTGNGATSGLNTWDSDSEPAIAPAVRIVSIDPANDKVVLKNFGGSQDISGYFFCRRKSYQALAGLTPTTGDLVLDQDEEAEFTISIDDISSDFALYNTGGSFTSETAIVDFMMFGDDIDDAGREAVAIAASIWVEDTYVNGVGPFTYTGDGSNSGAGEWSSAEAGSPSVRLLNVDPANNKVTLKNLGNASQNLTDYWFCARKQYDQLNTLTISEGNLILAPNEELEFTLEVDDTSSDVALYNTGGAFASATAIVDFMMFGEDINDAGRESVAVEANIWTENDFVDGTGSYTFIGEANENGSEFWEASTVADATFAVTNTGATAYVFNGGDLTNSSNPDLTFKRGNTYVFEVSASGHPFLIKSVQGTGTGNTYDVGVTNNGIATGTITFTVPSSAPDQLFYNCEFHGSMTGVITITD